MTATTVQTMSSRFPQLRVAAHALCKWADCAITTRATVCVDGVNRGSRTHQNK